MQGSIISSAIFFGVNCCKDVDLLVGMDYLEKMFAHFYGIACSVLCCVTIKAI